MKNKIILLIFGFVFVCFLSKAQSPTFQWAKGIGGIGNDNGKSIAIDVAGNVYTIGYFNDTTDFDPGAGVYYLKGGGCFISKLDASGNFVFAKRIANSNGYAIAIDTNNNVYITGSFGGTVDFDPGAGVYNLTSIGGSDIFITKLDAIGNFVWAKSIGGLINDEGLSIVVDAVGNVFTTGYFDGTVDFDPGVGIYNLTSVGGPNDIFVCKLNVSGVFVWAKSMGGSFSDYGYSITVDVAGNVYTTGHFPRTADFDPGPGVYTLTAIGEDIFVSKLDASGNFVWAKRMGGGASGMKYSFSIAIDLNYNVYTTGFFNGIVDFDPNAGVYNLTAIGQDIFISKLDTSGNFVWAKSFGGTNNDGGCSIAVTPTGNVYSTGYFVGTVDFDLGAGVYNLTSTLGSLDIFITKLDSSGAFAWAKSIGGGNSDAGYSIAIDNAGSVFTTGFFQNTADFDPGVGVNNLTSAGGRDIFIHKMCQTSCPLGISELPTPNSELNIFPNPNTGVFKLQITETIKNGEIVLFNAMGQKVCEQTVSEGLNTINANHLAKGLYNYILLEDKQKVSGGEISLRMSLFYFTFFIHKKKYFGFKTLSVIC